MVPQEPPPYPKGIEMPSTTVLPDHLRPRVKHKARLVAFVPAHNEQEGIRDTIKSLMEQTYPFEYVLVIADNCTDDTISIVGELQKTYGYSRLRLLETTGNEHKKAGALNQGFRRMLLGEKIDYLFSLDADTILDPNIFERGVMELELEPATGGICSAYRALPLKETATRWKRFLWRIQNIEFGLANAWRVENYKSARVLPGVSVLYRMEALRDVYRSRGDGTVWATDSLVEDYRLTLDLKDLGWGAKSSMDMTSWSDVPLKLRGKGGLWDQRKRWYSGTVDEIRRRGLKKHSRYELFTIVLLILNAWMRLLLYGTYGLLLAVNGNVQWVWYFLIIPVVASATQLYRLKYADQRDKWQILMTATLVVNEVYAFYRELIYTYSIWLSYRRPNREW